MRPDDRYPGEEPSFEGLRGIFDASNHKSHWSVGRCVWCMPSVRKGISSEVLSLSGEALELRRGSTLGRQVQEMVTKQLPRKEGATCCLFHQHSWLILDKTLLQQGIVGDSMLACTYKPTDVRAAWGFLIGETLAQRCNLAFLSR